MTMSIRGREDENTAPWLVLSSNQHSNAGSKLIDLVIALNGELEALLVKDHTGIIEGSSPRCIDGVNQCPGLMSKCCVQL